LSDVDHEGLDAVSWAAIGGHLHCVELMLDRGCDIDHSDKIKRTPLHLASFYGHEQVVSRETVETVLRCRLLSINQFIFSSIQVLGMVQR